MKTSGMKHKTLGILLLVLFSQLTLSNEYSSHTSINWLPEEFKQKLTSEKCSIPKNIVWSHDIKIPADAIIIGQFAQQGQYDIAIICHSNNTDRLFIHWGGDKSCPNGVRSNGESISSAHTENINNRIHQYGVKKTPTITHNGIEDLIIGKSSFINYCHDGKWLNLDAAD